MDKRLISVVVAFSILIGCICLRLYFISSEGTKTVSRLSNYYSEDLAELRGEIVDCKGRKLTDIDYSNIIFAKPTVKALSALDGFVDSQIYENISDRMKKLCAVSQNIGKTEIIENSDIVCIRINQGYNTHMAQHIIGYVNSDGDGVTGIEKAFNNVLKTNKKITARLKVNAGGNVLNGSKIEILNDVTPVNRVQLTINRDIQQIVQNAVDEYEINQGAAVVLDAKSGAVRAMVSRPDFDADKIEKYLDDETMPLINRSLEAYAVGSIFKIAVCIAALDCGCGDFTYNCTGSCKVNNIRFGCYNSRVHGNLDMQKALETSCNCYFINLARKIGYEKLMNTVNLLGFGQEISLADGIVSNSGILPNEQSLEKPGALANFSFGQGSFTASPLQISQMLMTVADSGKYIKPYIVEKAIDEKGNEIFRHQVTGPVVVTSENTAKKITKMLESVVQKGNAIKAKPEKISAAGKTATAQTGTFYKNGVEICNTWFGGFFPADEPEYIVVILKQGGNSGAEDCAPVFKKITDEITELTENS
ncbi:MAG: penicillin-binding protein 2 [Ruminococcus sp.]|nr:penicillin-binding protein 2 [Candidatus Copronaster equi]